MIRPYLRDKRAELIWALSKQEYNGTQIGEVFGIPRSTVHDIIKRMPQGWESPWVKMK